MELIFGRPLSEQAEIRRVRMLYARMPTGVASALIGTFLSFIVLFDSVDLNLLKAWAVYMVSVISARLWLWNMFGTADLDAGTVRRWDWLFAIGALLTGIGWGALFGPLHPPTSHPEARIMIVLLVVVVSFAGAVFLALSNKAFWLFVSAALGPAIVHYLQVLGPRMQWPVTAAVCCVVVLIMMQRTLHRSAAVNLERGTQAETLLAEQQAIFDSSPVGIAVLDNEHIAKCNVRLGELLGRRIQDLTGTPLRQQFLNPGEASQFLVDCEPMLARGKVAQGMYRLRRADGTQFWAELSGRRMTSGATHSVWMIADVTLRVANERRTRPRAPDTRESPPPA